MTISVLQERQTNSGGATVSSISIAYSSAVTAGSAQHAIGTTYGPAITSTQFSDNRNTWPTTLLDSIADGFGTYNFHQVLNNSAAGTTTVTLTPTTSGSYVGIWIKEIGGAATSGNPDGHGINGSNNATSITVTASNTVQPALVSVAGINQDNGYTVTLDASYTNSPSNPGWTSAGQYIAAGSKVVTSTGSQSLTATQSTADDLYVLMAIFDQAGGAAPAVQGATTPARLKLGTPMSALKGTLGYTSTSTAQVASTANSASAATAALTGSGSLAGASVCATVSTASLGATAALTATGIAASSATANLIGTYALSAAGISITVATANAMGAGALAATAVSASSATAPMTGSGALTAAPISATAATANIANYSAGAITSTGVSATAATGALTGAGVLDAAATASSAAMASLGGALPVTMTASTPTAATAQLTGIAALSAAGISVSAATASMIGAGAAAATAISATSALATLGAAGTISHIYASSIAPSAATATLQGSAPGPIGATGISVSLGIASLTGTAASGPYFVILNGVKYLAWQPTANQSWLVPASAQAATITQIAVGPSPFTYVSPQDAMILIGTGLITSIEIPGTYPPSAPGGFNSPPSGPFYLEFAVANNCTVSYVRKNQSLIVAYTAAPLMYTVFGGPLN